MVDDKETTRIRNLFLNVRQVKKLPKRAVRGQVIFNKTNGHFYMGVIEKEVKDGSSLEETSV